MTTSAPDEEQRRAAGSLGSDRPPDFLREKAIGGVLLKWTASAMTIFLRHRLQSIHQALVGK